MTEQTPCPRHPNRPHQPGHTVCTACHNRAHDQLQYLATMWPTLLDEHHATHGTQGRVIHRAPPTPANISILDTCRDLHAILTAWVQLVIEDRHLDHTTAPTNPPSQAMWLTIHLDWLMTTPEAPDACDEINDMRRTLAAAIGDTIDGLRVMCPLDDCGHPLRVDMHNPDQHLQCRGCGAIWTAPMLLRHVTAQEAESWLDPASIEACIGIPDRTLRRWAHRGLVHKRGSGRTVQYRLDEALALRWHDTPEIQGA